MKTKQKLLILVSLIVICFIGLIRINNKNIVKSVRSEHELMTYFKSSGRGSFNTIERILTLPFSMLIDDHYYKGYYERDYYIEDGINYGMKNEASSSDSIAKDYSKTNIQVDGVDEADIIKTDGDYIYSISGSSVVITNVIDPNNPVIEKKIYNDSSIPNDLLLYKNYLVVFSYNNKTGSWGKQNTLVTVYDVSNPSEAKSVKSFELYEPYYTSRCIDGNLYVFSKGYLRGNEDNVSRIYKEDLNEHEIKLKDIKYIKDEEKDIQTLIAHLDLNNIKSVNVQSYLIDISNAYVSKNNIYLMGNTYSDNIKISSLFTFKGIIGFINDSIDGMDYDSKTKIYKFEINKNKGVVFNSTTTIEGSIINQYSLDEKDNHLRIALETDEGTRVAILNEKLKLIGETSKVAEGERMYASRFIGDKAYLVTYRNTDPLFVIDLSSEKNPKVMGELKIPGYSTYLHPYDKTHLIGIGMDTEEVINRDYNGNVISTWVRTNGMKMALFDVSDITSPREIAKTTIGDSNTVSAILSNPKALLFSKEKNLLAIPVNNYNEDFEVEYSEDLSDSISYYNSYNKDYIAEGYFVYNIDLSNGFELKGIINHEKNYDYYYYYGNSKLLRGLYIDNDLYTVSESHIKVNNLEDLSEISSLDIE